MLAFLPSAILFVVAPLSVSLALWLGFAAAFAVGLSYFGPTGKIRVFDGAGLVLFGAMALYEGFIRPGSSQAEIGLIIEGGLFLAILYSMATRRPFTSQYVWLKTEQEPELLVRAHTLLTAIWASAFAALCGIDALCSVNHSLSPGWASAGDLVLFGAALTFTWQMGVYIDTGRAPILLFLKRR
ncbi:hypothetical protein FHS83_000661 [Rhizomicrobium palustre]|uniref:Uncharacterized protein n=1 Tax=Rhizomicrobium palustre TaxID=189966 RepID=A0A846MVF1_9PROT|nr:hypothetical protein [Rhizomicrobium palustre]NIK87343.1 hypothetical protein [Rhizomicrobium palustre]